MLLEGSCQCGAVSFKVESPHPYPYQRCYCSICRKTQGGGGYAINLGALYKTLEIEGKAHIKMYHARVQNPEDQQAHISSGERHFCGECGTALWVYDAEWPDLVHPFASAIDTPLPKPPEHVHMMLEFKPDWVEVDFMPRDQKFLRYSTESIAEFHERVGPGKL
ncbi:GFA family protein [Amantichitinum ursilacus]|uniref:Glutathione-dependent formaldehyde-activating enzyme n=1 Tax=Amantichitinum ursilacus TaxID=857265 RepID=A0A0N0XFG9_9NEIS|nr:GFA family protein [Amantichitinum ursilacus]KPC49079.1 Glutathione-dependent formaldehyde-activating enzyme [Amantichitinum ursilacus]